MLADNEKFLEALPKLFSDTRENGSINLTIKRYDYQGKKQERQKKRRTAAGGGSEEAMRLMVDKLSLDDKEYATLVRAATEKKKLSTLVAPADLDHFLACYHGVFLTCAERMKKKERVRRKRAAVKRQAARKAKAKAKAPASSI